MIVTTVLLHYWPHWTIADSVSSRCLGAGDEARDAAVVWTTHKVEKAEVRLVFAYKMPSLIVKSACMSHTSLMIRLLSEPLGDNSACPRPHPESIARAMAVPVFSCTVQFGIWL